MGTLNYQSLLVIQFFLSFIRCRYCLLCNFTYNDVDNNNATPFALHQLYRHKNLERIPVCHLVLLQTIRHHFAAEPIPCRLSSGLTR